MIWPPPERALEGELVRLEPLAESHRKPVREAAADPRLWRYIDQRVSATEAGFDAWFEDRLAARRDGDEHAYATLGAGDGEALGSTSFLAPRPLHDGVEIGMTWLAQSAWGGGANVEAKLLMLGLAFERLGCMRVELKADALNERSRAAMEALPARYEGTLRKHMLMPISGPRDTIYYSVLDEEWPRVRANLQARLSRRKETTTGA